MARVDVAVPCYQHGAYLRDCVASVLGQGVDVRVLIVDNASTDDSPAVARELAADPRVELVLRGLAVAITWVAATVGLGAAVISRGGTRRQAVAAPELAAVNDMPWQTPTPVTGVVAARRPTPSSTATKR